MPSAQTTATVRYDPPRAFTDNAHVTDPQIHARAEEDPEAFWEAYARRLAWDSPWSKALAWDPPHARWFPDGTLNASYNCLDRHLPALAKKEAYRWIGEDGSKRSIDYGTLHDEVARLAGALRDLGVEKGDRVTVYLPMVPELPATMLACARIGAAHNVVFGGFSPQSLAQRVADSGSDVVVTCDGYYRRGDVIDQKARADAGLATLEGDDVPTHVIVVRRMETDVPWTEGRDVWYHDMVAAADPVDAVPVPSDHMLFMMYTSGTTGRPKAIMHGTGGYLTGALATTEMVLDMKPEDVYWCMADIGWITGHSYIVYGPLLLGATSVLYEGAPDWPAQDRPWRIIEEEQVTVLYTAPTAIRAFMRHGDAPLAGHDLSSLRLLGSVGEPINPAAWDWYHKSVGGTRCPVVDTWWQTETGMMLIAPLPGIQSLKPGSATRPLPGIRAEVLDDEGQQVPPGTTGNLVITRPWPAMMQGLWNDDARYREQYWGRFGPEVYVAGDGATVDEDGDFWIAGRLDDVMNVAGHRLSTAEVESALVGHASVAEAAVVPATDAVKGQVPIAFVLLADGAPTEDVEGTLREAVAVAIGAIARPARVVVVSDLPKTRSGKIMRRLLKDIVAGRALGDVTTLRNPEVAPEIEAAYKR